jgi:hypothetical protein
MLKGEVRLTVSSTLPIQQAIAYSISCSKMERKQIYNKLKAKLKKERTLITKV